MICDRDQYFAKIMAIRMLSCMYIIEDVHQGEAEGRMGQETGVWSSCAVLRQCEDRIVSK
jgi:hypothetical protein